MVHSLRYLSVSTNDYYQRVFFCAPSWQDYYRSAKALWWLCCKEEWSSITTGFYIFRYRVPLHQQHERPWPPSLRLTYFLPSPEDRETTLGIIRQLPLEIIHESKLAHEPLGRNNSEEGGFRRFLCIATRVALDLIDADLATMQSLYRRFRDGHCRWSDTKAEFVHALEVHSEYYRSLSDCERHQFVLDTEHNRTWSHNFVGAVIDD